MTGLIFAVKNITIPIPMKRLIIFSFIIILIGLSCDKEKPEEQIPFLKTSWTLSFIRNTTNRATTYFPSDAARKINIVFTDSLNVVLFNGVCNTGSGVYSFSEANNSLEINFLGITQIYCKYVEWEAYTIQNLDNAFSYKINGSNLIIYSKGTYDLYFEKD
jgi:heat shock protein HslJ